MSHQPIYDLCCILCELTTGKPTGTGMAAQPFNNFRKLIFGYIFTIPQKVKLRLVRRFWNQLAHELRILFSTWYLKSILNNEPWDDLSLYQYFKIVQTFFTLYFLRKSTKLSTDCGIGCLGSHIYNIYQIMAYKSCPYQELYVIPKSRIHN